MSARTRFVQLALSNLGSVVLWNSDGPSIFDCSGLVAYCLHLVGARDIRATHNAQRMSIETPRLAREGLVQVDAKPGDLAFYGADASKVTHVAIWLAGGRVLSADGATRKVTDLRLAQANPAARVRLHDTPRYRSDFLALHRNAYLDSLEDTK